MKTWAEVKEVLREKYPGMTKAVFCMGKNPAYYGVTHTDYVKQIAQEIQPRVEHRKNPCRLYLRVNKEIYKALLGLLDGRSVQEYLLDLVEQDLQRRKSGSGSANP